MRSLLLLQPTTVSMSTMSTMLLFSCLAVGGLSSTPYHISLPKEEFGTEKCPPCELLFRNLERAGEDNKLSQVVRVQERGEPKSGTGMMFDWATGTLMHTCNYLKHFFGEKRTSTR